LRKNLPRRGGLWAIREVREKKKSSLLRKIRKAERTHLLRTYRRFGGVRHGLKGEI